MELFRNPSHEPELLSGIDNMDIPYFALSKGSHARHTYSIRLLAVEIIANRSETKLPPSITARPSLGRQILFTTISIDSAFDINSHKELNIKPQNN